MLLRALATLALVRVTVGYSVTLVVVGASYGVASVLGVLAMAIPRRWRAAWVGCWIMVAGRAVCIGGDFTSVGHLIALMLGMLLSAGLLGALTCYSATHL
jgi:Rhomboid-like protein